MIPTLLHLRHRDPYQEHVEPCVLILTPYQPPKEDIFASTQAYIEAAHAKCTAIYDTDNKAEQVDKLKTSSFMQFCTMLTVLTSFDFTSFKNLIFWLQIL